MTDNFDTLQIYKGALESGYSEEQALFQAEFARKTRPPINLEVAFMGINKKFDMMNLEIKYLEKIVLGIGFAIIANVVVALIKL